MRKHLLITTLFALAGVLFFAYSGTSDGDQLKGLWAKEMPADGVRFYYFHGDGNGLYRYGRRAFTNTNSFTYTVDGSDIDLVFRKTGEKARVHFTIDKDRLTLKDDPREAEPTTYVFVPYEIRKSPAGRMWIDMDKYATGGSAFSMYQLTPADLSGRGTGWHHRGDFNDWSTEALTYRLHDGKIDFNFELTGERYTSDYAMDKSGGSQTMSLTHDPRNWWQRSRFSDMGRSFGSDVFRAMLP